MADTYFCFSDECGAYSHPMSKKFLNRHPFYIRTTLLMNSMDWKDLNKKFKELKSKYSIPLSKEVKWAYLWTLLECEKHGKDLPDEIKFLKHLGYSGTLGFITESLALIQTMKEKTIVITFTNNNTDNSNTEKNILKWHLQEHMQRIEMTLQVDEQNLGVLFFDPLNKEKDEMLREIYHELYYQDEFIENFHFIKDSLNIEKSHHSVGIQIADYISGCFSSILKSEVTNDYTTGVKLFFDYVYPFIRTHHGKLLGYGIREVPRSKANRDFIQKKLSELRPQK